MPESNSAADSNPLSALSSLLRPPPPTPMAPTRVPEPKPVEQSLAAKIIEGRSSENPGPARGSESRPADARANGSASAPGSSATARAANAKDQPVDFFPTEAKSLEETGLTMGDIEGLVLKFLLNVGAQSGRTIAERLRLPFLPMLDFLAKLKQDRLVIYKGSAGVGDFVYELTETGTDRARRFAEISSYCGAAPVTLQEYLGSVKAQSPTMRKPNLGELCRAFADLLLSRDLVVQLGQAVHAGRGMFLHGPPGNGKTSIAERISRSYGDGIWIPRTISVWGEFIRLYDPSVHEAFPLPPPREGLMAERKVDERWVRIHRPTIVAGGELTLANLELSTNPHTGIHEAPLQLKANGGVLVIDDFGRQRISVAELLNRWIVPLEKRRDYLSLTSGVKVEVPFDQLVVFSTNLEPRDLVDEAFFRRIPYKVNVPDPSEDDFRLLWNAAAKQLGVEVPAESLAFLIENHYRKNNRPFRFCHPRDLLLQVANFCSLQSLPPVATKEALQVAVRNYFSSL